MKYAIIDIGSNTIRLNAYAYTNGLITPLFKKKTFASLSSYIDDGKMSDEGIKVLLNSLEDYHMTSAKLGISKLFPFATAAIRNAKNCDEILEKVNHDLGMKIDLISGKREAELGFLGIDEDLRSKDGIHIDSGGGSTEILIHKNQKIVFMDSIPEGSLSLYSKYVSRILPYDDEMEMILKAMKKEIKKLNLDKYEIKNPGITAIGGSARAILKLINFTNNSEETKIKVSELNNLLPLIERKDVSLLKNIVRILPERIHTLPTGVLIYKALCDELDIKKIYVSPAGIRDGYLKEKLQ